MFDIYFPDKLDFRDYINICQVARTWTDGYDRKDKDRLSAALAPTVTVDYSGVVPAWGCKQYARADFVEEWLSIDHLGLKPLATQHLLGLHYFKSVTESTIVVEWQQIASHGRRVAGEDFANSLCQIEADSNHRAFMEHTFVKVDEQWRIAVIKPSVLFMPGNFMKVRRPENRGTGHT